MQTALFEDSTSTAGDTTTQGWLSELALWHLVNHSTSSWRALLQHFGTARVAVAVHAADWQALGIHAAHVKRLTEWQQGGTIRQQYDRVVASIDRGEYHLLLDHMPEYPPLLARIDDPPPVLFYRGNLACLHQPMLAIVGTRKPSPSARKVAHDFACHLAQSGVWVTSGLAQGIDAASHVGALAAGGGRTVAVLGTGIDRCYPTAHQGLYERIVQEGGLVLSEFLPGAEPLAHHFPRRNRIVSGLSLGVLVVEAALQSGSLITARLAAEQGRDVLVVPGHIDNAQVAGSHQLIREGARLVASPEHVLEDLNLAGNVLLTVAQEQRSDCNVLVEVNSKVPPIADVTPAMSIPLHLQPLLVHLDWHGQAMDQLVVTSQIEVATLAGQLMELELLGLVVQVNGLYQRCRV